MTLDALRKKIDSLDEHIIDLLSRRASIAKSIGKVKHTSLREVYVPSREKMVFDHIRRVNNGPLPDTALCSIYREIMSSSLALESPVQVAYMGPPSTFSHQAACRRFGASVDYVAGETIGDVFDAVQKGQADYGVVPIENSTEGAVTHTLDMFMYTPLKICAEVYLPISHHLVAKVPRSQIRQIMSNSNVLGQCRNWLRANMPGVDLVPVTSTARAAEMAANDKSIGAIASILAAKIYKLRVLASEIQDLSGNITRFLVIGQTCAKPSGDDKTSIFFAVKHKAGALHQALGSFKKHKLNMTKIESRPSKLKAWEYCFFIDLEGHVDEPRVARALNDLDQHCTVMTVLGSYPKAPEGAG